MGSGPLKPTSGNDTNRESADDKTSSNTDQGDVSSRRYKETNKNGQTDHIQSSKEHVDNTLNSSTKLKETARSKDKPVFECDIIPVSYTHLCCKCAKCDKVVDLDGQTVIYKDKQCLVFSRTQCKHERMCTSVSLDNDMALSSEKNVVADFLKTEAVYCKSSTTQDVYFAGTYLKKVYLIELRSKNYELELVSKELFRTASACFGLACFDGGFALLIDVGHHLGLPPWQIQYVTLDGQFKTNIYRRPDGGPMLTKPTQIVSNFDENVLYVIDIISKVLTFDVNGDMLRYVALSNDEITHITTDFEDNIYITCGGSLLQLNSNFDKRVLYGSKACDHLKRIDTVTWINPSKSLVVIGDGFMTVFKLV